MLRYQAGGVSTSRQNLPITRSGSYQVLASAAAWAGLRARPRASRDLEMAPLPAVFTVDLPEFS